jgi:hypothetical protein
LEWSPPENDQPAKFRTVPGGQGILWSTGPDMHDDGGTKQGLREDGTPTPEGTDLIYLVPQWKKR